MKNDKRVPGNSIPGHSKEAGLTICKHLGVDPFKVQSIIIYPLYGTLVVKTESGYINCHLVPFHDKDGEMAFRIVKDN